MCVCLWVLIFFQGSKSGPPTLPSSCAVFFRAVPMTKVGQPRQQLNPTFSDKSPLFDLGSGWSVPLGPMQIKCIPNLGSIRVVAVKHHHAQNWEPHLSCPVPRLAWDGKNFRFFGKNFRFFPKTGVAKPILGEKLAFFARFRNLFAEPPT